VRWQADGAEKVWRELRPVAHERAEEVAIGGRVLAERLGRRVDRAFEMAAVPSSNGWATLAGG
jgi:hypothetical protein